MRSLGELGAGSRDERITVKEGEARICLLKHRSTPPVEHLITLRGCSYGHYVGHYVGH